MKSITDLENLNNQIVLLRLDLNVPILDGKITDTNRIDKEGGPYRVKVKKYDWNYFLFMRYLYNIQFIKRIRKGYF